MSPVHPLDDEPFFDADDYEPSCCTGECRSVGPSKQWVCSGTAYGGDDDSYFGEGRCYCMFCGADGDA